MTDSTRGGRGGSLIGGGLAKKRRMGSALFGARTGSGAPLDSEAPADSAPPLESEAPADSASPLESEAPADSAPPLESEAPADSASPLESEAPADSASPLESEAPADGEAEPTPAVVDGAAFVAAVAEPSPEAPPADPTSWGEFDMLSIADDPSNDDLVSIPTPQPPAATPAPEPRAEGRVGWALAVVLLVVGGLGAWWLYGARAAPSENLRQQSPATVAP